MTSPTEIPELNAMELAGDGARVRYTPPAPTGIGAQINAFQIAELGAQLAALGMEKSMVTALLHECQANAVKVYVESAPSLLNKVAEALRARLNRVMQDVQALNGVEVPVQSQGMLARAIGVQGQTATYVSKEMVLRLLAGAMERGTPT